MMSSNLVGCSTDRSAAVAPLKILSTDVAARRNMSKTDSVQEISVGIDEFTSPIDRTGFHRRWMRRYGPQSLFS
jgi:hypothetical protein